MMKLESAYDLSLCPVPKMWVMLTDLEKDLIFAIAEDSHGTLWVGTFHLGLWRYEPGTDRFISYRHDQADPYSLLDNRVQAIYEDRSGVMWLGHYRSGLSRYVRRQDQFSRLKIADGVYAICQDRHGQLWIGGDSLHRFDRKTQTFTTCPRDQKTRQRLIGFVYSVYADSQGYVWMGTFGGEGGVVAFHPDSIRGNPRIPPVVITHFKVFDKPMKRARRSTSLSRRRFGKPGGFTRWPL